jgi:hypothetical protein
MGATAVSSAGLTPDYSAHIFDRLAVNRDRFVSGAAHRARACDWQTAGSDICRPMHRIFTVRLLTTPGDPRPLFVFYRFYRAILRTRK